MYNEILNDDYILNIYKRIEKYEEDNKASAYHGKNHAINVSTYIELILKKLGYNHELIEEAKVAGLLHDLGCCLGKENHEIRSYSMAKEYLDNRNIELNNKDMVLEAIKDHRNNFTSNNIITRSLVLSDKLDIKRDRVAPEGYKIPGMRQYQYINDIEIDVEDGTFIVNFIIDAAADLDELINFYFTKKVFDSISSFSESQGLEYCVYMNNLVVERSVVKNV